MGQDQKTILLIDDDANIRKMVGSRLLWEGFRVVTASTGPEGLEMAQAEHPSVIILDLMLPLMHGRDVLAHLKEDPHTAHIPVIVLSVLTPIEEQVVAPKGAAHSHIVKPYQPKELIDTIHLLCRLT